MRKLLRFEGSLGLCLVNILQVRNRIKNWHFFLKSRKYGFYVNLVICGKLLSLDCTFKYFFPILFSSKIAGKTPEMKGEMVWVIRKSFILLVFWSFWHPVNIIKCLIYVSITLQPVTALVLSRVPGFYWCTLVKHVGYPAEAIQELIVFIQEFALSPILLTRGKIIIGK